MEMKLQSNAKMVHVHEKSIVLGGSLNLYPISNDNIEDIAEHIKTAIRYAEQRAYDQGVRDAQGEMKKALGLKWNGCQ